MGPSSQASTATADYIDDQRFAELLKPIKDLTQNWEVSIEWINEKWMFYKSYSRLGLALVIVFLAFFGFVFFSHYSNTIQYVM